MTTFRVSMILCLATIFAGCEDDPVSPTVESVSGTYEATTLTTTEDGQTIDYLAEGATIEIVLRPDGTTTGEFLAPGADEGGADFQADLAGT